MCVLVKMYYKLCRKVKDIECEEEMEDVFHSEFRADIESIIITESEMSTFSS